MGMSNIFCSVIMRVMGALGYACYIFPKTKENTRNFDSTLEQII